MDFITFMCENYRITKGDTLWQYFHCWKQRESMGVCRSSGSNVLLCYHKQAAQKFAMYVLKLASSHEKH